MASIERTAYPRFRHEPNARELQDLFTPAQEEAEFARSIVRGSDEHFNKDAAKRCCRSGTASTRASRDLSSLVSGDR